MIMTQFSPIRRPSVRTATVPLLALLLAFILSPAHAAGSSKATKGAAVAGSRTSAPAARSAAGSTSESVTASGTGNAEKAFQATVDRILRGNFEGVDTSAFIDDLENRIARKPGQENWIEAAGILHFRSGRFDKARRALLTLKHTNTNVDRILALSLFEVKDYRRAVTYFNRLHDVRSSKSDWEKYCRSLAQGGVRADAVREWEAYRERYANSAAAQGDASQSDASQSDASLCDGLDFLAEAYRHPLQKEKLMPILETILKRGKDADAAGKLRLELAGLYGETNLRAVELRTQYLQAHPEDSAAARTLGAMYEARGELKKALAIYLDIAPRFSSDLKFNRHLAQLLAKTDKDKAILYYETCRTLAPKDFEISLEIAHLQEDMKRPELALSAYQAVLDVNPTHPEAKARMMALAAAHPQSGPWLQSMAENEKKNPRDHAFQFQLAKLYQAAGDRENAYKYLEKALRNGGEKEEYAAMLPLVLVSDVQILKYFALLQKMAQQPAPTPQLLVLLGRGYSVYKNQARAAEAYGRVLAANPKLLEGHRQPILDLFAVKDYPAAEQLVEKVIVKDPKDVDMRRIQVACLSETHAPPAKLRAAIGALVALEPYDDKWYLRLAELDLAARDSTAARLHAREWVKMHPDDKRGLEFLEPLAFKAHDEEAYFSALDNMARLDPANQAAFDLKMAYYQYEAGKYSLAAEALGKLASAYPNDARFWNRLGVSLLKLGRDNASEPLGKAYHLEPGNLEYARNFAASLSEDAELKANAEVFKTLRRGPMTMGENRKLARALFLTGDYSSSARIWDLLAAADPDSAVTDSTAGLAYLRSGQVNKAKPLLEKRLAANPRDVSLLATLAEMYSRQGDAKGKMAAMEKLVQEDGSVGDYVLRLARDKEKAGQAAEALSLYSQWTFKHADDVPALKSFHDLADRQKDTTSLIDALRMLARIPGTDRGYRFQLAETYYARSGETKELEELVKANPDYRQGKRILTSEYHAKEAWDLLAPFESFITAESVNNSGQLEILADLYANQKKIPAANQAYFSWLAVKRKDRDAFDKVHAYAKETKSPNLVAILKLGCESFPADLDLRAEYGSAEGVTRSALLTFEEVLAKQPGNAEVVEKAAGIAKGIGDRAAQAKWSKRWSELKPDEEKPWRSLMDALDGGPNRAGLAEAMEGLLRLEQGNRELTLKLAALQEGLSQWDKAIGLYRSAVYLSPKDKPTRDHLINLMKAKGKKEDLADVLTEIQNIDSSAHEAQFELAKLLLQKDDKVKAYAYLSIALEQNPLNQNYQRLLPHVIQNREQTLRHFKLLVELAGRAETSRADAANTDLFYLLAQGYMAQSQWDRASEFIAATYRLAPKRMVGNRDAVLACFRGKNYVLAAELSEKYFELNPDFDKEIRQTQILCYEKTMREPAVVRKALQLLLAFDKDNAGGLLRLAELDLRAHDTVAAIANIRACLTTSPNDIRAFKMLLPLISPDRGDQRVTYVVVLEKLAQLDSAHRADHQIKLADFYFERKTYRQTARLLSEVVEARPKDAPIWYRLGQCRSRLQVGDQGLSCFKTAYDLQPANVPFAHTYAQTLEKPEEFKANLNLYKFVEDRGPSAHERYGLAMAYFYNGDAVNSAKAWDKALPDPSLADKFIPEAGVAYLRTAQPAKALPLYKLRLEREANNLGLLDTLCGLFAKTGDEAGRVAMLESLVRVDPTFKDYQLQLARVKEKARDTVGAIDQYGQWTARNNGDAEALKSMHRLAQGKRDTASLENALRLLVQIKGADPEYSFQLAELQFKFVGATEELERLVKAHPLYHRGRVILAKEYYRRYDMPHMVPYEKALADESLKDRELLTPLAELLAYENKKAPANKAFRDNLVYRRELADAATAKNGAGSNSMIDLRQAFDKAYLYSDANKSPFLVEILEIGNRSFPAESPIQQALAVALGKNPRALELYKQILERDGNDLTALQNGSELAMSLGKPAEAVTWMERWSGAEPGAARPWQLLADAYNQLKNPAKTADALEHQVMLSPTDAALAFHTGQAYLQAKNKDKALELLIRADELKPKDPAYAGALLDLLHSMTEEYAAQGQAAKAVELYGMILERDPKNKKANLYTGMWLAENRDFGSAEAMLKTGLDQSVEKGSVLTKAWRLLGDCLAAKGDGKTALEDYKRALSLDPADKAAAAARLEMTRNLGLTAELRPALADMVRLDSSNAEACLGLAELLMKDGKYPQAAQLYARVIVARDKDPEVWGHYGEALEGAPGRQAEALAAWDKAYALGDRTPYTLHGLSRLHREAGSLDKAAAALEDLVIAQPENDEACSWLAELNLSKGNLEKAEELYTQALQDAPDKIEYSQGLAEIFARRGDAESVVELLEPLRARLTVPGRITYADALRLVGKPEAALPILRDVWQRQPSARALASLSDAMLDRGKALEVKHLIDASAFASDPEVKLRLGKALLVMKERDKAADLLQGLAKQDPENAVVLYNLALAHYGQKNFSLALNEFKQALVKRADLAVAAYYSGLILVQSGQVNEGRAYFFALVQNVSKYDRSLGLHGLAEAALAEKKDAEASDYLVQSADMFSSSEVWAELAELGLKLGRVKDAENWAQKSLESDEDYAEGIVALAEVMMAQGHKDEARDFLKEALVRNPRSCELHLEYAKVYMALENIAGLVSNSREALSLCPEAPLPYYYAGVAADKSYQKKQAEEYFNSYKRLGGDKTVLPKGY